MTTTANRHVAQSSSQDLAAAQMPARVAAFAPRSQPAPPQLEQVRPRSLPVKGAIGALVALIAAIIAWLVLRSPAVPAPLAAVQVAPIELAAVDVVSVAPQVLSRMLPLSGSMSPAVQATVKAKVGGEVELVRLREGQDVTVGEVIARIDTRNLQAQYERELAGVDKARAELDLAMLNRDKNRALLEQRYISQTTYESTQSAYAGSLANLKLAQAQARLAQISLEDATIRAPFSGTLARRLVEPGEKVAPDSPLVTLVDLQQMVLEAAVPAADIPAVRIGQKVRFTVSGFGARQFEGEVQRINPVTSEGTRAITIYIVVPNPQRELKGGMFWQGALTIDATQPVLAVERRAVREQAGAPYVYTLREGTITRTPVTLGPVMEGNAALEVRSGLTAGERVIVTDISASQVGQRAAVREATAR